MPAATITSRAPIATRCVRPSTTVVVLSGSGVLVGVGGADTAVRTGELTGVVGLTVPPETAADARSAVGVRCGAVMSGSSVSPGGVGVESVGMSPRACGVTAAASAPRNSSALWNRSAGDLESARSTIADHQPGKSGRNVRIGVGGSEICICTIEIAVSALNGSLPVSRR